MNQRRRFPPQQQRPPHAHLQDTDTSLETEPPQNLLTLLTGLLRVQQDNWPKYKNMKHYPANQSETRNFRSRTSETKQMCSAVLTAHSTTWLSKALPKAALLFPIQLSAQSAFFFTHCRVSMALNRYSLMRKKTNCQSFILLDSIDQFHKNEKPPNQNWVKQWLTHLSLGSLI